MVGVSVEVGARVGAGDAAGAKRRAFVGVGASAVFGAAAAAIILALRPLIATLFTHDESVVDLTYRCVPALALLVFTDALNVVVQGTLSGAGIPKRVATANLFGWYGVAAPVVLGLVLGLDLDESAAPVLLGCCALALATSWLVQFHAICAHDWTQSVDDARRRLGEAPAPLAEPLLESEPEP